MGFFSEVLKASKSRMLKYTAQGISHLAFEEGGMRAMMAWGTFLGGLYGAVSDDTSVLGGATIGAGIGLGVGLGMGKNVLAELTQRASAFAEREIVGVAREAEKGPWNLMQMPMIRHTTTIAAGVGRFAAKHPIMAIGGAYSATYALDKMVNGEEGEEAPNIYANSPTMNNAFENESPMATRFRMGMEASAARTMNANFTAPMGRISSMRIKRVRDLQASTMGVTLGLHRGRHG